MVPLLKSVTNVVVESFGLFKGFSIKSGHSGKSLFSKKNHVKKV